MRHDSIETRLAQFDARGASAGEQRALAEIIADLKLWRTGAQAWVRLAQHLLGGQRFALARHALDAALEQFPLLPDLVYLRGNALRMEGNPGEAERNLRAVLDSVPEHRDAALSLAFMLREQGRYTAAVDVMLASAQARAADSTETLATLGFLRECGAFSAAHALAQQARARWPENVEIAATAGEFALALGEFATAQSCLRAALDPDPRKGASWLRLSRCQRYTDRADADVRRYEQAWQNTALEVHTRACIGFALGKALDDLGDTAGATQVLRAANALVQATQPWDRAAWEAYVTRQLALAHVSASSGDDFAPVFVIGLPRTGTTLAATLLSRDAQLRDRGELNWIGAMQAHLDAQDATQDAQALRATAQLVSTHMRRDDSPAHWYLDKNPLNFRYLGLIAALFPRARIVHCRRNPRDTALSLWMQHFDHADVGFAYAFDDIAHYVRGYEQLMTHWRATLPLPIFDLDYEALVTDQCTTLARLADFIGSRVVTAAAENPGAIATASVWQARQPVYTDSIDRWQRYAAYLPELARL